MSDEIEEVTGTAVATREGQIEADRLESEAVDLLRENMNESARITKVLLARAENATGRDVAGALRAVADVQSKSVDGLLKLTNRAPGAGKDDTLGELLQTMVNQGYLKVNAQIEAPSDGSS